jgi:hypothetical protein
MLACICTYGEVMGCPIMAHHTAQQEFPINMLNAVLGPQQNHRLTHGNGHLLVNPKYKELWGKYVLP